MSLKLCVHVPCACLLAYMHACVRAYVHACVRACVRACMRACVHTCVCAYICVFICVCQTHYSPPIMFTDLHWWMEAEHVDTCNLDWSSMFMVQAKLC